MEPNGVLGELTANVTIKTAKMNRKLKFFFLAFGIFVFIVAVILILANPKKTNKEKVAPSSPSSSGEFPTLTEPKFTIKTPEGNVEVNNVYRNAIERLSKNGVAFKDNDYYMAYYPEDQGFLIVIQNTDIEATRKKAEADFLEILGITQEQACKLRVSLTVPLKVNEKAGGGNYGLSFCPNGKDFPK